MICKLGIITISLITIVAFSIIQTSYSYISDPLAKQLEDFMKLLS